MLYLPKSCLLGLISLSVIFILSSCGLITGNPDDMTVATESVKPGSAITKMGFHQKLTGNPISIGEPFPPITLVDTNTNSETQLNRYQGSVVLLSIVPSVNTVVCEAQTHVLGEEGDKLSRQIKRITISHDPVEDLQAFSKEAKLTDLIYLSDEPKGEFGPATGFGMEDSEMLARGIVLLDSEGIIRYIQVVPELTHLPDMETAFKKAEELLAMQQSDIHKPHE